MMFCLVVDYDIDGAPLNTSNNSTPKPKAADTKPKFAASKWETVDEDTVKAQGMLLDWLFIASMLIKIPMVHRFEQASITSIYVEVSDYIYCEIAFIAVNTIKT